LRKKDERKRDQANRGKGTADLGGGAIGRRINGLNEGGKRLGAAGVQKREEEEGGSGYCDEACEAI